MQARDAVVGVDAFPGDKDDGQLAAEPVSQFLLESVTADARELDVDHHKRGLFFVEQAERRVGVARLDDGKAGTAEPLPTGRRKAWLSSTTSTVSPVAVISTGDIAQRESYFQWFENDKARLRRT